MEIYGREADANYLPAYVKRHYGITIKDPAAYKDELFHHLTKERHHEQDDSNQVPESPAP